VDLAVYRIVQESLTNAAKYAGANAHVAVCLDWRPVDLHLEVRGSVCDGAATPRVLVLTSFNEENAVQEALAAGASGVPAQAGRARRPGHRRPALRGRRRLARPGRRRPRPVGTAGHGATPRAAPELLTTLTARELEVLILMVHGRSNGEINAQCTSARPPRAPMSHG
jgi:DNA-binding NarL/FixJ family response regulator